MPNHVAPHQQYPPYQQNWGPPQGPPQGMMQNHVPGKGAPPQSPQGSPRPINYLKQHLQVKGGYQQGQPPPPQGYGNGPGMHQPMGPPHHMGPPMTNMGPPQSTGAPQMPPNSHPDATSMPPHPEVVPPPQDNGIPPSIGAGQLQQHPVTSIVTTGPDGTTLDEASQQSTLSNASAG